MLKATIRWLFAPRHVWACVLVIAVALAFSLHPGTSEQVVRLTGLGLELLGVFTAIWGLVDTRRFFNLPSIVSKFGAWLRAAPFRGPRVVEATGHATLGGVTCKGRGYATYRAGDSPTVESRIDALENNLQAVHQRISGLEIEYDGELRNLAGRIRSESASLSGAIAQAQSRLESFGTGSIAVTAMGTAWLLAGLVLSTASLEIVELLGHA